MVRLPADVRAATREYQIGYQASHSAISKPKPSARAEPRNRTFHQYQYRACWNADDTKYAGIKLSRGRGLPWDASRWSQPQGIITGTSPLGCVHASIVGPSLTAD